MTGKDKQGHAPRSASIPAYEKQIDGLIQLLEQYEDEKADGKKECEEWKKKYEDEKKSRQELQNKLKQGHAPGSASILAYEKQIDGLKRQTKGLEVEKDGLNDRIQLLEQYEDEKADGKKECQEWKKKYEDEKKSRQDLQNKLKQVVQEGHALGSASVPAYVKQIDGLKTQIKGLKVEKDGLNERLQISEQYGDKNKKECEELEKKYEDLREYGDKNKKECEELEKKYEDLRNKLCTKCKRIN